MSNDERKAKFQLIRKPRRVPPQADQFIEPTGQGMLFPLPKRDLLIFLVFPLITEDEFTKTLELARPATILELRRSPRFDIGQLTRQDAFRWFEATHAKYYDLSSALTPDQQDPLDPLHLVRVFLNRSGSQLSGPIMLLLSDLALHDREDDALPTKIARLFMSASKHQWQTLEIPQYA
jgi:hypothetical protein